jgi:hypothetical protein
MHTGTGVIAKKNWKLDHDKTLLKDSSVVFIAAEWNLSLVRVSKCFNSGAKRVRQQPGV